MAIKKKIEEAEELAPKQKDWGSIMGDAEEPADEPAEESAEAVQPDPKEKGAKALDHPAYKDLEDKLTTAEQKSNEYWNEVLRLKAEIENIHRRAERDVANAHQYGLKKFVLELLPVLDSLEHGLDSCSEDVTDDLYKNIKGGLVLTRDIFLKTLNKFKVEQVSPLGEVFNPELHEAMSMQPDPKAKPNTVLRVLQKGYLLNGRLIRPALVIVAKKP